MRPALYQAHHNIMALRDGGSDGGAGANEVAGARTNEVAGASGSEVASTGKSAGPDYEVYDVVGPICESADVLGSDRRLPLLHEDDWLVICDVGAYGRVMASTYNSHPLPEEKCIF